MEKKNIPVLKAFSFQWQLVHWWLLWRRNNSSLFLSVSLIKHKSWDIIFMIIESFQVFWGEGWRGKERKEEKNQTNWGIHFENKLIPRNFHYLFPGFFYEQFICDDEQQKKKLNNLSCSFQANTVYLSLLNDMWYSLHRLKKEIKKRKIIWISR